METCVVVESLISIYYIRKREVGIAPAANCEAKEETVSRRHSIDKMILDTFEDLRSLT